MPLQIKPSSGSGSITLQATTGTTTNDTLTLPAATGTVLTTASTVTVAQGGTGITSLGTGVQTAFGNSVNSASGLCTLDSNGRLLLNAQSTSPNDASGFWVFNQSGIGPTMAGLNITYQTGGTGSQSERMRVDSNGYLLVGYTSSNGAYRLQVNSQIYATSSTIATSDARYKENVEPITDGLALVNALNPVSFDWKQHSVHNFDTEHKTVGFLAQEVQTALNDKPYLNSIIKANECELLDGTKEEFLGIAEGNMIAILTSAIKELSAKLDAAIAEIETLKGIK